MSAIFNASADSNTDVEYETISSTQSQIYEEESERLHDRISKEQLEKLHNAFSAHADQQVGIDELRNMLEELDITFNDSVYTRLFLKINQNRDFRVDWNEFVSYLIFGFQEEDPSSQKESLILPISVP